MKNFKRIISSILVVIIMSVSSVFAGPYSESCSWYYDDMITSSTGSYSVIGASKDILLNCYWQAPNMGGTIRFTEDNTTIMKKDFNPNRLDYVNLYINYDPTNALEFVKKDGWYSVPKVAITPYQGWVQLYMESKTYYGKDIYIYYMNMNGVRYRRSDNHSM